MSESDIARTDPGFTVTVSDDDALVVKLGSDVGLRGRPGLVWRGEWGTNTQYYQGDAVTYLGTSYISKVSISPGGSNPALDSNWDLLVASALETGDSVMVDAHNNMPAGTLQSALNHLEDQQFVQATTPSGATLAEGDVWYDTSTDRLNIYRNGVWEVLVTVGAAEAGYNDISLNGGYF